MTPQDRHLDFQIDMAYLAAIGSHTPEEMKAAVEHLNSLITQREPERARKEEEAE